MSGIQMTPIRWPDRWDPAFMDRLIREVFAKADVRNANAGTGITITGTPDEVATISASQDIEDLLAGGPLTALDSGVDTARQVVAGDGSIIITDNGGGSTLEIAVGTIQLTQLGALPDLSVIGVPTADDGFDLPTSINALANDTVLRRVNDELDWGLLTPGMFPDSTVAAWDSASIEIETDALELTGALRIYDAGGTGYGEFSHNGTNFLAAFTSTAILAFSGASTSYTFDQQVEGVGSGTAFNTSTGGTGGNYALRIIAAAGAAARNIAVLGHSGVSNGVTITSDGSVITQAVNGVLRIVDASGSDYLEIRDSGSAVQIFSNANRIDLRAAGVAGVQITSDPRLEVISGGKLRVYDAGNTDYVDLYHDGTQAWLAAVNSSQLILGPSSGVVSVYGGSSSNELRVFDQAGGDYWRMFHDGTNAWLLGVNAGQAFVGADGGVVGIYNGAQQQHLRIYTTAGGHYLQQWHDGTYANIGASSGSIAMYFPSVQQSLQIFNSDASQNGGLTAGGGEFTIRASSANLNLGASTGLVYVWDNATATTPVFRIYDQAGTDYAGFYHDGTDFNTNFAGTTEWNIATSLSITGSVTATGDGTFNTSDERLKRGLIPIDGAIERVRHLRGYTYEKHVGGVWEDFRRAGVIAQHVERALPEAVMEKDGYLYVSDASLSGLFASAINELAANDDAMEARIAALEAAA